MVSNTTLITPARLNSALSGTGAGILPDLIALTDPGADRLLGWDDSASAVIWFSFGAGIELMRASHSCFGGTETAPTVTVSGNAELTAGQTFYVAAFVTTSANSLVAASSGLYNVLSIVELA